MGGIKGFKSQKILKNKLAGYSENQSVDIERYATVQELTGDKHGIDVVSHGVYLVTNGVTAQVGSNVRVLKAPGHAAQKGDQVKFESDGTEAAVLSIPDNNTIILGSELSFDPTGLTFDILRHVTPRYSSDGEISVAAAPVYFNKNGTLTGTSIDTVIPANSNPLPSGLMIKKDGVYVPVELDTTNPYAHTPIPVAITDVSGSSVVNITAGDLDVNIKHDGVDPSSVRIGDGTTLAGVTTANELKTNDATGNYLLGLMAAKGGAGYNVLNDQVVAIRNNQIEVNFETLPSSSLLTQTVTGTGSIAASSGHTAFSTGAGLTASAKGISVQAVTYRPAAETYAYFTAAFTNPTSANSFQRIGIYDTNNGFFIGYNGTTFGLTKRTGASDTFTARTSWNGDLLTGASNSQYTRNGVPEALNLNYSNLFRIRYAWLGSAPITFEVYSPDGYWVAFHTIKMPNSQLNPSIQDPNLEMCVEVGKTAADTTDLKVWTACWGAGSTSSYSQMTDTVLDTTMAATTRSMIIGKTTGGGGGYVPVKVNPSGALAVEATVTSSTLPTGAATSALQTTGNSSLSSIDTKTPALGQALMAASTPVVIASNQSGVPVTGTFWQTTQPVSVASLPLPTGAATEATLNSILLGGATAANQTTGNGYLNSIVTNTASAATSALQTTGNTSLNNLDVNLGAKADTAATTDTGTFSLIALFKRSLQWLNSISTAANLISGQLPASLGIKTGAGSLSIVPASDSSFIMKAGGKGVANTPYRNDYSSVNVTTAAYTQVIASLASDVTELEIFDSSGQTLVLAVGAAGAEVAKINIFPGGNGRVPLYIATGSRIAIKAVSANATVGEIDINFYSY